MASGETMDIKIEFGGGAELLFGNIRSHNVAIPSKVYATADQKDQGRPADIAFLIDWMKRNILKEREELFIEGKTV
jgi:ubiquitin related modifier 1